MAVGGVSATIHIGIDASGATAQLAALGKQMAALNKTVATGSAATTASYAKQAKAAGAAAAATGMFTASTGNMRTAMGNMSRDFDKGTTSFRNYRQNSLMWNRDHSNINRLAAERVKTLQTRYVALGKEVNGVQQTMAIRPTTMMKDWGGQAMFAAQRAMLFRRNLEMGANSMINWGKNTQWAGRQMMVGMGIPIGLAAAGAVSSFKSIEEASISFKRVYGDATTSAGEKAQALQSIHQNVAKDMTKYGIAVSDTLDVAARAAATGARGDDLTAVTAQTMRLATLGQMDYQAALEATIAAQSTFGIKSKDMARTVDYMNAVENQSILTMEDMSLAVPRAANAVNQAGGSFEDLGTMMAAFRVGGVQAEQAANALKSGIASMINPTETASKFAGEFGINLGKIVKDNKGDVIGMFRGLGKELNGLSKYDAGRVLEQMFGKFQYSKIGAMIKNLGDKQVKEVERLGDAASNELAKMSEQELAAIENSPLTKFQASIERLKDAIAPLGGQVLNFITPLIEGMAKVAGFFEGNDIARNILFISAGIAGLIGVGTMITGVFANFFGTMIKGAMKTKAIFARLLGRPLMPYMSMEQIEAATAARQLGTSAEAASAGLYAEAQAANVLESALNQLSGAQMRAADGNNAIARTGGNTSAVPTRSVAPTSATQAVLTGQRAHIFPSRTYTRRPEGQSDPFFSRLAAYRENPKLGQDQKDHIDRLLKSGQATGYNAKTLMLSEPTHRLMDQGSGVAASQLAKEFRTSGYMAASPMMEAMFPKGRLDPSAKAKLIAAAGSGMTEVSAMLEGLGGATLTNAQFGERVDPILRKHFADAGFGADYDRLGELVGYNDAQNNRRFFSSDDGASVADLRGDSGRPHLARTWGGAGEASPVDNSAKIERAQMTKAVQANRKAAEDEYAAAKQEEQTAKKKVETAKSNYENAKKANTTSGRDKLSYAQGTASRAATTAQKELDDAIAKRQVAEANLTKAKTEESKFREAVAKKPDRTGTGMNIGDTSKLSPFSKSPTPGRSGAYGAMLGSKFEGAAAKLSTKMFGLGMATDMVTFGLSAMGKDVPAWTHMLGTGMMTMGMFGGTMKKAGLLAGKGIGYLAGGAVAVADKLRLLGPAARGMSTMLSMAGPVGIAASAAAAGFFAVKQSVDEVKDKGKQLADSFLVSENVVASFASEVGKESASAKRRREALEGVVKKEVSAADARQAEQMTYGEAGKAILERVQSAIDVGGDVAGGASIAGQVAKLWGEGLINKKQSLVFGQTLADAAGVPQSVDVVGKISQLINGVRDPIDVEARVTNMAMDPSVLAPSISEAWRDMSWFSQIMSMIGMNGQVTEGMTGAEMGNLLVGSGGSIDDLYDQLGKSFAYNQELADDMQRVQDNATGGALFGLSKSDFDSADLVAKWQGRGFTDDQLNAMMNGVRDFHAAASEAMRVFDDQFGVREGMFAAAGQGAAFDYLKNVPAESGKEFMGATQIKIAIANGQLGPDAVGSLFSGNDTQKKNVLLNFEAATGTESTKLSNFLTDAAQGGFAEATKMSVEAALMSDGTDITNLVAKIEALNKISGSVRSKVGIDVDETSLKKIEAFAKLDPKIQKKIDFDTTSGKQMDAMKKKWDSLGKSGRKKMIANIETTGLKKAENDVQKFEKQVAAATKKKHQIKVDISNAKKNLNTAKDAFETIKKDTDKGDPIRIKAKAEFEEAKAKIKSLRQSLKDQKTKISARIDVKEGKLNQAKQKLTALKQMKIGQKVLQVMAPTAAQALNKLKKINGQDIDEKTLKVGYGSALSALSTLVAINQMPDSSNKHVTHYSHTGTPPWERSTGGPIGFASGGWYKEWGGKVAGPGGPEDDKIPAMLSNGEYVVRAKAVDKYGAGFLHRINTMRYADGGEVQGFAPGGRAERKGNRKNSGKDKTDAGKEVSKSAARQRFINQQIKKASGVLKARQYINKATAGLKGKKRKSAKRFVKNQLKREGFTKKDGKFVGNVSSSLQKAIKRKAKQKKNISLKAKKNLVTPEFIRGLEEYANDPKSRKEFKNKSPKEKRKAGAKLLNQEIQDTMLDMIKNAFQGFKGLKFKANSMKKAFMAGDDELVKIYESMSEEEAVAFKKMKKDQKDAFIDQRRKQLKEEEKISKVATLMEAKEAKNISNLRIESINGDKEKRADLIGSLSDEEMKSYALMTANEKQSFLANKQAVIDNQKKIDVMIAKDKMKEEAKIASRGADKRLYVMAFSEKSRQSIIKDLSDEELDAYIAMTEQEKNAFIANRKNVIKRSAQQDAILEESFIQNRKSLMSGQSDERAKLMSNLSDDEIEAYKIMNQKEKDAFIALKEKTLNAQEAIDKQIAEIEIRESNKNAKEVSQQKMALLKKGFGSKFNEVIGNLSNEEIKMLEGMSATDQQKYLQERLNQVIRDKQNELLINPIESIQAASESLLQRRISNAMGGKTRGQIDAQLGMKRWRVGQLDRKSELARREIDDINEAYQKQSEALQDVESAQQRIANIERGRLSVAQALSSGDVAGAARALQQAQEQQAADSRAGMREVMDKRNKAINDKYQEKIKGFEDQAEKINDEIYEIENKIAGIEAKFALELANKLATFEKEKLAADIEQWNSVFAGTGYSAPGIPASEEIKRSTKYNVGGFQGINPVDPNKKYNGKKGGFIHQAIKGPKFNVDGVATAMPVDPNKKYNGKKVKGDATYNVTVNANGNMDANDVARQVMYHIERMESGKVRASSGY